MAPTRSGQSCVEFENYELSACFDEMFESPANPRPHYRDLENRLRSLPAEEIERKHRAAHTALTNQGITYTLQGNGQSGERILPYDIVPRIIAKSEWDALARGLEQRVRALNLLLDDVYNDGRILRDRIIPRWLIHTCKHYRRQMRGVRPNRARYVSVAGIDLIRCQDASFAVLEDNLRVPSGVSYMLANRQISKSLFPDLFREAAVQQIEQYPQELLTTLRELAPNPNSDPTVAVLTPGCHNSAYFEHAFLARQMGVELVLGRDLVVHDNFVYMRTTRGLQRIDVIYRRTDDDFLDPMTFRRDSQLGVPGLFNAYRAGTVSIANGIGSGLADDKAVYAYLPAVIRYYLGEDPILANIETYIASTESHLKHILDQADKLVIKAVGEAGGYGMCIGPFATAAEIAEVRERVRADPRNYIAQPMVNFSRAPCYFDGSVEPRHVDLRPFVLFGDEVRIVPGGLTRVALERGSLVVNSSQGGGTKDTWVVNG